ncbi:MAG: FkbM family methyltransferase [Solirubrobacteraceae bacterium]
MLIPLDKLISWYGIRPTGVLHLGAHLGEEAESYAAAGIGRVLWVEGNPELAEQLRGAVEPRGHEVVVALIDEVAGRKVDFHVTSYSQASSILELGTHKQHYPDVEVSHELALETTTVDALAADHDVSGLNMLNIDLQGAELRALKGAAALLAQIDIVYTEVNRAEVYAGCALVGDIDEFLAGHGLRRVATRWTGADWGDALYVRGRLGPLRRLREAYRTSRVAAALEARRAT